VHTCGELLYSFTFWHYPSYAKVAELKETLIVDQFAKEPKRARPCKIIDEIPWSRGDTRKNSCSTSRCSRGSIAGRERRLWEREGRCEGGRGRTIRSPTSTSVGRRGPRCVCFVSFVRVVVHISQKTLKITDRVSVIRPHNRKGLTFVGQDAVGRQRARHG
jgi:hypothetical protein